MPTRMYNPPHPGRLIGEYLDHLPMSVSELARHLGMTRVAMSRIVNERAGVTASLSIKLGIVLNQKPDFFFNIQNAYDFFHASQQRTGLKKIRPVHLSA